LESVDNIKNFNELIIELEARLYKNSLDKDLLIREAFTLWYVLVEGIDCENFTEDELTLLLEKNYHKYKKHFENDADYNFIVGWMLTIAFWYFDLSMDEDEGNRLLIKAYKANTKNSLFKWAVRSDINLSSEEINNLRTYISIRFDQFYDYGNLIMDYFLDVINSPIR
jgi:hypothetical protein